MLPSVVWTVLYANKRPLYKTLRLAIKQEWASGKKARVQTVTEKGQDNVMVEMMMLPSLL